MDTLTELLRSVRLTGGVFLSADFTAPWSVEVGMAAADCAQFSITPLQLVGYHVVIEGRLVVLVDGEAPVAINAGEIVLFPRNDAHTLASAPGLKTVSARELVRRSPDGVLYRIAHGGGGAATRIVCGFLATEESYNPLLSTLPRVLKVDVKQGAAREWVEASVRFAASEIADGRLASSGVMSRLSESLLTEAVRQYLSSRAAHDAGWMNGLQDPQIGRALALIHQKPGAAWSAEQLASEVALSRSTFADRFAALVGMPPMRYVTTLRMQTAKLNLRDTRKSIAELAFAVGYESAEAFSRAFKREFGMPPAQWRERETDAIEPPP